jgi:murein DD-endopeptidase MepM/ murein hydrolase activator NlpD
MTPRSLGSLLAALLVLAALAACVKRMQPPAPVVAAEGGGRSATAAATSAAPAPDTRSSTATVQPGETLYAVSRRYEVPVRSLIDANNLAPPYTLDPGRSLTLPQVRHHVVRPGETLYAISRIYDVDTTTLARSNGLTPPYVVSTGDTLTLPAPVQVAATRGPAPVIQATAPSGLTPPATAQATAPSAVAPAPQPAPPPPPTVIARTELPPPAPSPAPPLASSPTDPRATPPPRPAPPPEETAALPPPPLAAPRDATRRFLWPVHGRVIASYGAGAGGTQNDGINIAAPAGTAVVAADAGVVAYAGNELRGYGNLVLVKHAGGWMTAYAHSSAVLVKRGDRVKAGQTIAKVGATGAVSEPQLHFEIRRGTRALDPSEYLATPAANSGRG